MGKPKEKPGVMMYWETFDVIENLVDGQPKAMLQAIRNYAQYGVLPDFGNDLLMSTLWILIRPKLDADSLRYEQVVEQRRKAGKASAEARARNNECQHPLADVDDGQQIQPTTKTTTTTAPTANTAADKCIMFNEEGDNGRTSPSADLENSISFLDDSDLSETDWSKRRAELKKRLEGVK